MMAPSHCLSWCFLIRSVLLVWVFLHDVEASVKNSVIHKKVGDTVELSSGLSTEGVTVAQWKYGRIKLTEKSGVVSGNHQFQSRLEFNPTDFSLTVKKLTLQDSGDFSFISDVNNTQRPTVTITLKVHEPITEQPILTSRSIQTFLNGSCVVLLECKAACNVSYSITVGNQTYNEASLQYIIRAQDGGTTFSCTVANVVSQQSASTPVTCDSSENAEGYLMMILIGAGGLLVIIIISVAVGCCCCRRRHEGSDSNELTVYADISDVIDKTQSDLKPCSLYETIDNLPHIVPNGPQTVYDRIQLNRFKKMSVSPYQEVS
ncbi:natural killer cell receptor 2B4 isoform X2 [Melanotaenia boesemani]|uniref:natural killer cell receptor 2B4 isoform X2 n=1 Tax=Melanotaenia boesemani TaxID=1250792 RepID=UPI001C04CA12|nr:natural killer cell receptor 2B4 isoform X2 [Melanotaenia boesemani]